MMQASFGRTCLLKAHLSTQVLYFHGFLARICYLCASVPMHHVGPGIDRERITRKANKRVSMVAIVKP
jgi:hypothetical protein